MPARAIACLLRLPRHIWPGGVRPSLWLRQPPCASSPWRDQAGLNLLSRYGDFGRLSGVFSPGHDLSEVGNGHSGSICKEGVCYRCPEIQTTRKCRPRCGAPGNHSRYSLGRSQRLSELRRICAMCQDYDGTTEAARAFYQKTQAKLVYAVTSHTPAEIVKERANYKALNMGLETWQNDNIQKPTFRCQKII